MQASVIWSVLVFEYLGIVLKGAPTHSGCHHLQAAKISPALFEEFTKLLSMISTEFDYLLLQGIVNIHIDNAEIKNYKRRLELF